MLWSTFLLLLASADYALGFHGRYHVHRHRARNQVKPAVEGVEMMEPWGLEWTGAAVNAHEAAPAHQEVHTKFQTLTKTVFEKCMPTNTGLTTKVLDSFVPQPSMTKSEPEFIHSNAIQPKPTQLKPKPESTKPEPTQSKPKPKPTDLKPTYSIPPKPKATTTEPTRSENTMSIPTQSKLHQSQTTDKVTTIHIHKTTTFTTTITATAPPVKISVDQASPSGTTIADSSSTSSSTSESVEVRPKPDPTRTEQAPNILQTLGNLPSQIPGDVDQILPGVATIVPVPNLPTLDQVLHPGSPAVLDWTSIPQTFSNEGFGGQSSPSGSEIHYKGNVGTPWGSNIISVSPAAAHRYKYVVQFNGAKSQPWTVVIWNKVGPDGKMDGWYGHSALTFVIAPGETHYVAFDEDSEGAWGAAPGTNGLPTDTWGGYTSTWGEFSFGDGENNGWSGWDVSAIQAQIAGHEVQGMRICMADGKGCSIITPGAKKVVDAYTESKKHHDGIGGAASPGPVRLVVDLDYRG